jgi:molecular chaperone DnaK
MELTRAKFEELVGRLVKSRFESITQVLKDCRLTIDDINRIVLVGGSTRIPLVGGKVASTLTVKPQIVRSTQRKE